MLDFAGDGINRGFCLFADGAVQRGGGHGWRDGLPRVAQAPCRRPEAKSLNTHLLLTWRDVEIEREISVFGTIATGSWAE
jgi:hypothetical protein